MSDQPTPADRDLAMRQFTNNLAMIAAREFAHELAERYGIPTTEEDHHDHPRAL